MFAFKACLSLTIKSSLFLESVFRYYRQAFSKPLILVQFVITSSSNGSVYWECRKICIYSRCVSLQMKTPLVRMRPLGTEKKPFWFLDWAIVCSSHRRWPFGKPFASVLSYVVWICFSMESLGKHKSVADSCRRLAFPRDLVLGNWAWPYSAVVSVGSSADVNS